MLSMIIYDICLMSLMMIMWWVIFSFLELFRTIGGNRPNQHCVFPFIDDDKRYDVCTTTDNNGIPRCCTNVLPARDFVVGEWGNCGIDCSVNLREYYEIYGHICLFFLYIFFAIFCGQRVDIR